MSDANLRELERRWRETGAARDAAALLVERVRVGDLEPEQLELASYCGLAEARLAQSGTGPTPGEDPESWLQGLERWGPAVSLRLFVVLARRHLLIWNREHPDREEPARMIALLEEHLNGRDIEEDFSRRFDPRNAYPYFMPDLGFNDDRSPLSEPARVAVGVVVGACNVFSDPEGLAEWLEDLADVEDLPRAARHLGEWALGLDGSGSEN